ncbi:Rv3654c family TadE-like protein [Nocardia beijingensis]|uniref:Rv3654c family TadE-like protein n=1 Tax=Nocardia beijingensis TaxID=95162 RepID=UPI002B4B0EDA|nr:Rv3654c family TadE-like protein [Nocardia beijingensis]
MATVFVCLALVALIGVTLLIAQVGVVVVARHRTQAAADMAALAAAGALVEGVDAACAEADGVARRMGTRIRVCEAAQWDATVTVERNVPIGLYGDRVVRASARAGPVEEWRSSIHDRAYVASGSGNRQFYWLVKSGLTEFRARTGISKTDECACPQWRGWQ